MKASAFCILSLATVTAFFSMISPAIASRSEPMPLNGAYIRDIDRSKQTFNGHPNSNDRPSTQKEEFKTICDRSDCIAQTTNLYAPPGAPKSINYHWNDGRWELKAELFFHCSNGEQIKSLLTEYFTPNSDGSFSGERNIKIDGKGCPGEGPGIYRVPFKLTPA